MTARPISRVASTAACAGGRPFSSTNRKMFSSTTIASSMTMPTASVSASSVIVFSVKPWYQIRPKVAMIEVGIAIAAMIVERQFHEEDEHDRGREDRADDQVLLDAADRRLDELGLVADDPDVVAGRQPAASRSASRSFTASTTCDGVRARLLADRDEHGRLAVQARLRRRPRPSRPRPCATSRSRIGVPVALADDDVAELGDGLDAAAGAERHRRARPVRPARPGSRRSATAARATHR